MDFKDLLNLPLDVIILGTLVIVIKWLLQKVDDLIQDSKEDRSRYIDSINSIYKKMDKMDSMDKKVNSMDTKIDVIYDIMKRGDR